MHSFILLLVVWLTSLSLLGVVQKPSRQTSKDRAQLRLSRPKEWPHLSKSLQRFRSIVRHQRPLSSTRNHLRTRVPLGRQNGIHAPLHHQPFPLPVGIQRTPIVTACLSTRGWHDPRRGVELLPLRCWGLKRPLG